MIYFNYYWTFKEIISPITITEPGILLTDTNFTTLFTALTAWGITFTSDEQPYVKEIIQRFYKQSNNPGVYFFISKEALRSPSEFNQRLYDFFRKVYETKDRYIALIKAQEDVEVATTLSSTTEKWYNDTPQTSGQYESSEYNTDYTKTTTTADLNPLDNLEQIKKIKAIDYYSDWLKEFSRFMIYEI